MEYSPMLVFMLWALTPSDCWPTAGGPGEQARVVEMPRPVMSVIPEGGYFTFNHGRPFLAERDPLTGAVDSNLKTTPVTSDDYLYEEYEESGESIDRKDNTKIYTRNDIASSSKESDLHKFLNLPVHYSSSGKFPLISSSYANTKVQGHGPLSNHKLYSSSSTTTATVSPSYYSLKTTPASTTPKVATRATTIPTTTKTTTTTTMATTPPTKTTTANTTPATTTLSTKQASATITTPKLIKITTTTTPRPLLSNYEYEYDYDYDKSDAEDMENSSQDYEFLGASSEVTKTEDKFSTINPVKQSSTFSTIPSTIKEQTTKLAPLTTTSKTTTAFEVTPSTKAEIKPAESTENITEQPISTMKPTIAVGAPSSHKDTDDLRPPKPGLSIELRPPQVQPTRPYSSVLPIKHQNFGYLGFVRYPDSPLIVADKKPLTVFSPQNSSTIKQETETKFTQQTKLHSQIQKAQQNSSVQSKPFTAQLSPTNKNTAEQSVIATVASQDYNKHKTGLQNDNTHETSIREETYLVKHPENSQGIYNVGKLKHEESSAVHPSVAVISPVESHKSPAQVSAKPNGSLSLNYKKPDIVLTISEHHRQEQISDHNKHQHIKPDYLIPQGVTLDQSKLHPGSNRPPQDYRPHSPIQGHAKPLVASHEIAKPQGIIGTENKMTQRPQATPTENNRPQVNLKPDKRPPISHLSHNNNPHEQHYSLEHSRPSNYQGVDPNRPHNPVFGLRITERPHTGSLGLEYLRPLGFRIPEGVPHEQKKPVNNIELRPTSPSVSGGEVRPTPNSPETRPRPEVNAKPVIFSKPQSGKRPDYNTVQFGQPSKVENHFISVAPGQENPSYSLQTSFSIGVPPLEQKQPPNSGIHGIGQVLFPDEEPEKRPPVWQHPRPPQTSHSDPHPNIQAEKYPRPPWELHLKPPHMYHKKEPFPQIKRKPLPNILPQFRPNAKIGHAEPHIYLKPREPYDTLQPPPLPRPQFLRLEQDVEETKPLVHRRNGQTSKVTTLQMMQATPASKRAALRIEDSNENEPVFVVYPSNGNNVPSPPSDGVVVGTRGPQRPLPPDNLDISDDLDSFPLDNNKNFQARVDTPVLKSKPSTSKPLIKNDFPYVLIKPSAEEQNTPGSEVTKDYTAFSPTVPSIEKDHDTEINIIPYLQDYMPFATKKPQHKDSWILGTDIKHTPAVGTKPATIEMTQPPYKSENHRVVSEGPQPQDFQAPFHASLTAPSQGWSVVQKKPNKEKNDNETTTIKDLNEGQTTEEPKFDIQNFKPQLFGGFKPIVPPIDKENKEKVLR